LRRFETRCLCPLCLFPLIIVQDSQSSCSGVPFPPTVFFSSELVQHLFAFDASRTWAALAVSTLTCSLLLPHRQSPFRRDLSLETLADLFCSLIQPKEKFHKFLALRSRLKGLETFQFPPYQSISYPFFPANSSPVE